MATTTSTLGSAPHGSICNNATHAVVPPSIAPGPASAAAFAAAAFEKRHRGRHALERRPPTAAVRRFGSGLASDDCAAARAPIFLYEDLHLPKRVGAARLQDGAAAVRTLVQERAEHVPLRVRRRGGVDVLVEHPEATREVAGIAVAVGRVVVVGRCWFAAHHRGLSAVSRARARAASTLCSARNLSSCFRGAIWAVGVGARRGQSSERRGHPSGARGSWRTVGKSGGHEGCYRIRVAGMGLT